MIRQLRSVMLILMLSRLIGVGRDLIIAVAFGFSRTTDLFYQAIFPLNAALSMMTGPFTTAFAARLAGQPAEMRWSQLQHVGSVLLRLAALGSLMAMLAALGLSLSPMAAHRALAIPLAVLAPAFAAVVLTGFVFAVATAAGRVASAALILLTSNAVFFLLAGAARLSTDQPSTWLLPMCSTLSVLAALWPAWIVLCAARECLPSTTTDPRPLPGLGHAISLASLESIVFLLTQAIILILASAEGEGVASAAALSQRVTLTAIGLFVTPLASLVMIRVIEDRPGALSIFLRNMALLLLSLTAVTTLVLVGLPPLADLAMKTESSALFSGMLPAFACWLLPMGTIIYLCRIMFGLGLERRYTFITVTGYLIANAVRVAIAPSGGLSASVLAGAGVEVVIAAILGVITLYHLKETQSR